ncbi:MAG: OadG family protein [Lachnospiraceae bacterium]|nr:OadG family protein [Lachnospiraceae bacterium]
MKKFLLVLGMITCMVVGMTGCGSEEAATLDLPTGITEEQLTQYADQLVESLNAVCESGMQEQYAEDAVISAALSSWESATTDMGDYIGIGGHELSQDDETYIVNVNVQNSVRPAVVEIILDQDMIVTSITTNVTYTFGELMEKAALNTVLGMGTVFAVLILISLIISLFGYIPKIQAAFSKKKTVEAPVKETAVDNTIAQIIEKEELSDDLELVAVIAAAIAASEGATSTDGFVVRSIRRRAR